MSASDRWVSASDIRSFCMADPLLDWLSAFGRERDFVADTLRPGYDADTDMLRFLREKGARFERMFVDCLREQLPVVQIAEIGVDSFNEALFQSTLNAMRSGVPVIYQPILWDAENKAHGRGDLLVRSDVINQIVEAPVLSEDEATIPSPGLSQPFHYRVIDVKFTGFELNKDGVLGNSADDRRRKGQLLIYNRALAAMQGYWPTRAYLMGRGWKQGKDKRGDSCLDRLAPADMNDPELHSLVDAASAWIRRLRAEGGAWNVLPVPTVPELYPNMSNIEDAPWHSAKVEIADELCELTKLWYVTPPGRSRAFVAGVQSWKDANCRADLFGLSADRTFKLDRILTVNRSAGAGVEPATVGTERGVWGSPEPLEFYVDFETVTDLDDDFSKFPRKGGQTLIFMIGCGHVENGSWVFRVFTCDRLTEACEASVIDEWILHMQSVRARLWPDGEPLVFHWSHAERSFLDTAYNSARERHGRAWPDINWYDFLVKVAREEPVVVRGAFAFGLKALAKAMHKQGLISTEWDNGPGDGLAAMVGAWRCDAQAREAGCSMRSLPLMESIERYNEVDCKVMHEIIGYLREHH